jgi:hypothetical protein
MMDVIKSDAEDGPYGEVTNEESRFKLVEMVVNL